MDNQRKELPSGVPVAELMASLSVATDLGMGQPVGFALQSCTVAMRLGEKLGLGDPDLRMVYFQSLLRYIGCNIETHLLSAIFGDELELRKDLIHADAASPEFIGQLVRAIRKTNAAAPSMELLRSIVGGVLEASRFSKEFYAGHCEIAERLAERLGFEKDFVAAIKQVYARWDGKGVPGLKGDAISPSILVVSLAQDAVYAYQLDGANAAIDLVRKRNGSMYAPKHVEIFCRHAVELLTGSDANWGGVMDLEPGERKILSEDEFDSACAVIADYSDVKSPYLLGHSSGVARLAAAAARQYGLGDGDGVRISRAGLLHDIGRVSVSAGIWGKEGKLSDQDWEKIRLHAYYSERILARSPVLADLGEVASLHHERLDGSGYHRKAKAAALTPVARILAAADVYHALTERRPHRPALSADEAAAKLLEEARDGRLDRDAVKGVLAATGQPLPARKQYVQGLSEREVEVLRLIAQGLSMKEMAQKLTLSPKTVDSHIQHIYTKINVSTRAGATLFSLENHLL